MNKSLLQAIASTLEDTQSIRNTMSGINAKDSPADVRLLLQSVFTHCNAIDSILEEALTRSCNPSINILPIEEDETDETERSCFPESFDEVVRLVVLGQMEVAGMLWDSTVEHALDDVIDSNLDMHQDMDSGEDVI